MPSGYTLAKSIAATRWILWLIGTRISGKYYFRSLCCLNGELCIVDSKEEIRYAEYVELLEQIGVQYALYLDMGSGWNHSWYRERPAGEVTVIHPWVEKCKYTTNWIVFR